MSATDQPADWVVHLLPGVVGFPIERGQQDVTHRGASRRSAQHEEARKTCHGRMLQWVLAAARLLCATGAMKEKKHSHSIPQHGAGILTYIWSIHFLHIQIAYKT